MVYAVFDSFPYLRSDVTKIDDSYPRTLLFYKDLLQCNDVFFGLTGHDGYYINISAGDSKILTRLINLRL